MNVALFQAISTIVLAQVAPVETREWAKTSPLEAKKAFVTLLDRPKVPLDVKVEKPDSFNDVLLTEHLSIASEKKGDGTIERVPLILVHPEGDLSIDNGLRRPTERPPVIQAQRKSLSRRRPVVIALHGTGGNKEGMRSWLVNLAKRGIIGVAINAQLPRRPLRQTPPGRDGLRRRHHPSLEVRPTQPQEHPFYYDTCWDLWRTVDYLVSRDDVDPKRIGMLGISMGGIETWLAASVDDRIAVAVPAISVQSFRWSLENEDWQGEPAQSVQHTRRRPRTWERPRSMRASAAPSGTR